MMKLSLQSDIVLLGKGGNTPGVELFDPKLGTVAKVLDLPSPNSVYAIDFESTQGLIAIGSKAGLIHILGYSEIKEEFQKAIKLIQGAPVLSVCWCDHELLIASDIIGRCIAWQTTSQNYEKLLDVKKGVICSLLCLNGKNLFGLSNLGIIHVWDSVNWQLIQTIDVPIPAAVSGLVKMVYWPAMNGIIYPSQNGTYTLLNIQNYQIDTIKAHDREAYAVTVWKDNLVTAGLVDCEIKIWKNSFQIPVCSFGTPTGVLSMVATGDKTPILHTITAKGAATIIHMKQGKFEPWVELKPNSYRMVKDLSHIFIKEIIEKQKRDKARKISEKIQIEMGRVPSEQIQQYFDELDSLGFPHLSLLFKAQQADSIKEFGKAIDLRTLIVKTLPPDNSNICPSLINLAISLENAWLIHEACQTYRRILSIDPNYNLGANIQRLERYENYLQDAATCIIEPDIELKEVIQSYTAIGKLFKGRYLIKKLDEIKCGNAKINPELFKIKYEKIEHCNDESNSTKALIECVWMISRGKIERNDLVTFLEDTSSTIKGIQLALEIISIRSETVVIPMILFDWRNRSLQETFNEENKKAASQLDWIINNKLSTPYIISQYRAVHMTLRRLFTETRAQAGESAHAFRL